MTVAVPRSFGPRRLFGWRLRQRLAQRLLWAVLALMLAAMLVPLGWAILGSFKTEAEYREIPVRVWPRQWTLEAYQQVISKTNLPRGYFNSMVVAGIEILCVLFTSSIAGYVFSQKRFWGKDALFLFVLASSMVPFTMLLIPLYLVFTRLGLQDTYLGVVLPTAITPYGIFLCRQFIGGVPKDLFDAASIDGASDFTVYWRIVLPLSKPILTALTIFTLIQSFNSLLWPLVIISSEQKLTLPLVLARITLVGEQIIFTEMLAAVVLGSVPMIVAFLILHRNFIQGIRFTGLGGG